LANLGEFGQIRLAGPFSMANRNKPFHSARADVGANASRFQAHLANFPLFIALDEFIHVLHVHMDPTTGSHGGKLASPDQPPHRPSGPPEIDTGFGKSIESFDRRGVNPNLFYLRRHQSLSHLCVGPLGLHSRSFSHPIGPEGAPGYRTQANFFYLTRATVQTLGPHSFERPKDFHHNAPSFQKPRTYVTIFCETLALLG